MPVTPVPTPICRALADAMGGWGPYTVREIEALFNLHGFEHTGSAEPEAGVCRQTAADFIVAIDWADPDQRLRLINLIQEVLEHYPPQEGESPLLPGRALRGALERVGVDAHTPAGAAAALSHPPAAGSGDVAGEQAPNPFDLWPPGRIRVFMSHVAGDRAFVGQVAAELERADFACFVAHEEIEPSLRWQQVIEAALDSCEVMVTVVTLGFRESDWCEQEVGWALGRGLVIIPVAVDMQPYGFFGSFQAVQATRNQVSAAAVQIAQAIATAVFNHQRPNSARLVDRLADSVVDAFCMSGSFETTRRRFDLLRRVPAGAWTPTRQQQVLNACRDNRQIREANLAGGGPISQAVLALFP
jgi:hypothetical protein